jgi:hypothetical protein
MWSPCLARASDEVRAQLLFWPCCANPLHRRLGGERQSGDDRFQARDLQGGDYFIMKPGYTGTWRA